MNRLYGPRGAENLAIELNKYFSLMVKTVASEGGDVFKYAGDAMIGKIGRLICSTVTIVFMLGVAVRRILYPSPLLCFS